MGMSYDKESGERDQMSKNDEEILTEDIKVLELGKFSSKKIYRQS